MCFWCWFYFTARTSLVRAQWLEHTLALRLAARCRDGSRRRRELRKVWDLACGIVQATKNRSPPPLTVARFGVLLSQVSSSLAPGLSPFGSRAFRTLLRFRFSLCSNLQARRVRLFCLTPSLHIQMVGWGGAQAFHPKEDNAPGLVSLRLPIPEAISSLGCHAGGRAARTARAGFGVIL